MYTATMVVLRLSDLVIDKVQHSRSRSSGQQLMRSRHSPVMVLFRPALTPSPEACARTTSTMQKTCKLFNPLES